MTSIQTSAVVGPDGALDLHIPNLPPGERVDKQGLTTLQFETV